VNVNIAVTNSRRPGSRRVSIVSVCEELVIVLAGHMLFCMLLRASHITSYRIQSQKDMQDDNSPEESHRFLNAFESRHGNDYIVFDGDVVEDAQVENFVPSYYAAQGGLLGQAQGRGTTYFIHWHETACVLRHYHRGGWMARLNKDRYWWRGVDHSRAWREWYLLQQMYAQGLPVPQPVAAHVKHEGLFYRADIITRRIDNAQSLSSVLRDADLREQLSPVAMWPAIGATIRRFHDAGIYHADLNAHNLLLDHSGQCYLIDFDKGEQRPVIADWQQANLNRLQRSLLKLQQQYREFYFDSTDWDALLRGYSST
jgi:3-deoxy-D-manno-octulosonic acid kinase